ncbi:ABC transporter substrate-binding protein [Sphingomonas sp. 28-63-12]|uniref:ABC transporter substrate-binding protein n=1 Tax=Sphingomonas sp. 28-63-12 TaxID=1970434 RepID=UPI000BD25BC5|nr:MAG: ABC transporter substrate-binding protein [Sphingomonas sp. 28-63-12]
MISRPRRPLGLLPALLLAGCAVGAAAPSRDPTVLPRIVSINPCVDAVLMKVADRGQIAGISHYSKDPRATSIPLAQAARFTATSGTAEEVMALAPDLVIAGGHVAPATIAALARLHIRLVQLPVPATIAESNDQIRTIALAAGHVDRGARLVAEIDAAVRAAGDPGSPAVPALIWQGGGLVPGTGTLADELLRVSGYRNLSASYGLRQWDVLPLEYLVAQPPRVLLSVGDADHSDRMLGHPVLGRLKKRIAVRDFPERLLHCGGPTIIDAVARLAAVRRAL